MSNTDGIYSLYAGGTPKSRLLSRAGGAVATYSYEDAFSDAGITAVCGAGGATLAPVGAWLQHVLLRSFVGSVTTVVSTTSPRPVVI